MQASTYQRDIYIYLSSSVRFSIAHGPAYITHTSPTPDPKEREEGSVGFERVRHPPMPFQSWELWEFFFRLYSHYSIRSEFTLCPPFPFIPSACPYRGRPLCLR